MHFAALLNWALRDYSLGDAGIGLEPTPDEYIANMVQVGREIWRVLRDDGTMWLNLGDSYASSGTRQTGRNDSGRRNVDGFTGSRGYDDAGGRSKVGSTPGLKPKDLCGIPWRVALALQADGWYLRSDIIWHKPNPMPESCTDRPTKSHEYVFLLTKKPKYFYDADAVREKAEYGRRDWGENGCIRYRAGSSGIRKTPPVSKENPAAGRNRRTVWTIATQPYSGAHFATFPEKLVEPMIRAGTSEHGVCPECGAAWKRVTKKTGEYTTQWGSNINLEKQNSYPEGMKNTNQSRKPQMMVGIHETTGFAPTCDCLCVRSIPATVLDPFCGSGTTGVVARRLGRHFVGLDLSPEYLQLARARLGLKALDDWHAGKAKDVVDVYDDLPLFDKE